MGKVVYKDKDIIIYYKAAGEDSERITIDGEDKVSVLSRLDKPVEGLLPLSLTPAGNKLHFTKHYRAVITGQLDAPEGDMEDLLYHDKRANKVYPVKKERNGVKKARLHYVLKCYDKVNDISIVDITLDTGRTHQIRVQFASRKHPLIGDRKYGSRIKADTIALESYQLAFESSDGKKHIIKMPLKDSYPWNEFSSELF